MLSYEQLDFIADAYTPLLVLASACLVATRWIRFGLNSAAPDIVYLFSGTFVIYLLMFTDGALGIWPYFRLDYSTHTALALVLVVFLAYTNAFVSVVTLVSMLAYILLMLYQQYHSILDIVTTSLVVTPIILWLKKTGSKRICRQWQLKYRLH